VVPSPHPSSKTSSPFVIASSSMSGSPLSLMLAAMRVKSPFSQSALFGLTVGLPCLQLKDFTAELFRLDLSETFLPSGHRRFGVRMRRGTEMEFGQGEIVVIDPGHDAWIVGDEPCAFVDFAEVVRQASGQT